jgi:hypothetical protein
MSAVADDLVRIAVVDKARGYWATVFRRLSRDPVSVTCASIILLIALAAIFADYLHLANPYTGSMIRRLRWIGTPGYPLGTDELGRDMIARLIYGGRLSLFLGLSPVVIAFMIGTTCGVMAGYLGGFVNQAIMRTVDVFYAFPSVLLAIAISGALGAGITNSIVSLTIVFTDRACVRERDHRRAQSRLCRCGACLGRGASHHHARARARQRARADLRLFDQPDQRVHDPCLGPVVPRSRHQAAGTRMGPDAQHIAHRDLRQSVGGGAARRDDLHGVDLL